MVGREIGALYPPKKTDGVDRSRVLLEVQHLSNGGRFQDINFTLYTGEIFGLAGLVGAGRSEVAKAICGLYPKESGQIFFQVRC